MINRETRQGYAMHSGKGVNEQGHGPNGPSLKVSSTHDEMLDSTLRLYNRFPPSEALAQQPDHGIEHHSTRPSLLHVLQKGTGITAQDPLYFMCSRKELGLGTVHL